MKLVDAFIGPVQSKYSAVAVLSALLVICMAILFSKNNISLGKKLMACFMLVIFSLPSILFILFQLSCIVTGSGEETPWCGIYAWIIVFFIIVYSIIVVIMTITSMSTAKIMVSTSPSHNVYESFNSKKMTNPTPEEYKNYYDIYKRLVLNNKFAK